MVGEKKNIKDNELTILRKKKCNRLKYLVLSKCESSDFSCDFLIILHKSNIIKIPILFIYSNKNIIIFFSIITTSNS